MFSVFFAGVLLLSGVQATDVQPLLKALNAPTSAERAEAERALQALGPEVLPLLPDLNSPAGKKLPPEVRLRLNRVKLALEKQKSADSLSASMVALKEAEPLDKVLEKIAAQTGNVLKSGLTEPPTFTPAEGASPQPFWQMVDTLCDMLGLTLIPRKGEDGTNRWCLVKSPRSTKRSGEQNEHVTYLDAFRLEPLKITSNIQLDNERMASALLLELAWEPKLTPIYAQITLDKIGFPDTEESKAGELFPRTVDLPLELGDIRSVPEIPIPLKKPEILREHQSMTLGGTLYTVVAGPKTDFAFRELDQKLGREFTPVSHRTNALLLTLTRLRLEKTPREDGTTTSELVATVRYRYENPYEAMESHRQWVYENPAWLVNASGTRVNIERSEMLLQTTNEIALDLYFPVTDDVIQTLAGWTLIYPRPSGLYEVKHAFELRNIPIP